MDSGKHSFQRVNLGRTRRLKKEEHIDAKCQLASSSRQEEIKKLAGNKEDLGKKKKRRPWM